MTRACLLLQAPINPRASVPLAPCFAPCLTMVALLPRQGLSWVLAAQRWQTPLLTALFMHSSHSVSVTFYVSGGVCCSQAGMIWRYGPRSGPCCLLCLLCCAAGRSPESNSPQPTPPAGLFPAHALLAGPAGAGPRPGAPGAQICTIASRRVLSSTPVPCKRLAVHTSQLAFLSPHTTETLSLRSCGQSSQILDRFAPEVHSMAAHPALTSCLAQMTLSLFVGNAIKDLVCSPRPLGLAYGRQRLKFLAADSSDEEVQLNAKVGPATHR